MAEDKKETTAEKPKDPNASKETDKKESEKKDKEKKEADKKKKKVDLKLLNEKQITKSNRRISDLDKSINNLGIITGEEIPPIDLSKSYQNLKFNTRQSEEEYEYPDRAEDWFKILGDASLVMKGGKSISLSVGNNTKLAVDHNAIRLIAPTVDIKANRLNLTVDELIINGHKLNNRLIELSDFREMDDKPGSVIGNLQMKGTVLVKAWEPNLNRYVLIRRNIHMPLFSKILNPPEIHEGLKIDDPTKLITDFKAFSKEMLAGNMPASAAALKAAKELNMIQYDEMLQKNVFELKVKDYADYKTFHESLTKKYEANKAAYEKQAEKSTDPKAKQYLEALTEAYNQLDGKAKKYFEAKENLKNKKGFQTIEKQFLDKNKKALTLPEIPKKEEKKEDKKEEAAKNDTNENSSD